MTFEQFAEAVCMIPDKFAEDHFRSQHTFISHRGKVFVDHIGKLENIEREWEYLCANINIKNELQNINVSSNSTSYKDYYTDDLRDRVAIRYSKDIELLDYEY